MQQIHIQDDRATVARSCSLKYPACQNASLSRIRSRVSGVGSGARPTHEGVLLVVRLTGAEPPLKPTAFGLGLELYLNCELISPRHLSDRTHTVLAIANIHSDIAALGLGIPVAPRQYDNGECIWLEKLGNSLGFQTTAVFELNHCCGSRLGLACASPSADAIYQPDALTQTSTTLEAVWSSLESTTRYQPYMAPVTQAWFG